MDRALSPPTASNVRTTIGALLLSLLAPPVSAQVANLDVQPASLQLTVGETGELAASATDAQGNLIFNAAIQWRSTDPAVATVQADPVIQGVAIVTAVSPGVTVIEVRAGTVQRSVAVQVSGATPLPPPVVPQVLPPETVPDSVLPPDVGARVRLLTGRVRGFPAQVSPSCASGFLVGAEGLLMTSYRAIRGADRVEVEFGGRTIRDPQVAAYRVQDDLAVLRLPDTRTGDSLMLADDVTANQWAWVFGYPECGQPRDSRLRIAQWQDRPNGELRLARSLTLAEQGAALVGRDGRVTGIARGDATAFPGPRAGTLVSEARANFRLRQFLTAQEVARRENHAFGSIAISSSVAGAVARVAPLEAWHWSGLERSAITPFTFSGPMGRYLVELVRDGQVVQSQQVVIQPGTTERLALVPPVQPAPQVAVEPQDGGGGGAGIILAVLGIAGAGGAAFALLGGGGSGGGGGGGNGGNGPLQPGTITISVPNSP